MAGPKDAARKIVKRYGTRNPFCIADCLGAIVLRVDFGDKLKGVAYRKNDTYFIGVNSEVPEWYQRIICAHELGHVVCHNRLNHFFMLEHTLFPPGKFERQANEFAAELLISDEDLWEVREERAEYAARALGVTAELLVLKQISTF